MLKKFLVAPFCGNLNVSGKTQWFAIKSWKKRKEGKEDLNNFPIFYLFESWNVLTHFILSFQSSNIHTLQILWMTNWPSQVDNQGAEETSVQGFAGRPLRPRLPHLQAARRPSGGHRGNPLAEAGQKLADLPWTVDIGDHKKGFSSWK